MTKTMDEQRGIQLLAVKLHQMFCRDDHADVCRWWMERGNVWEKQAHRRWLEEAKSIVEYWKMVSEYAQGVDGAKGIFGVQGVLGEQGAISTPQGVLGDSGTRKETD